MDDKKSIEEVLADFSNTNDKNRMFNDIVYLLNHTNMEKARSEEEIFATFPRNEEEEKTFKEMKEREKEHFKQIGIFLDNAISYFEGRVKQELLDFGKGEETFSYIKSHGTLDVCFIKFLNSLSDTFDEEEADKSFNNIRAFLRSLILDEVKKKDLPECFKVGRDMGLQFPKVVRQLDASHGHGEISSLDFSAFIFALSQVLYNQSYQAGNEEYNSGLDRCLSEVYTQDVGTPLYKGVVCVSLVELCRLGYGRASSKDKKRMMQTISAVHNTYVTIKMGSVEKMVYLCVTKEVYKDRKTGAITYTLDVNPYFGSRISNNYGEMVQSVMKNLDTGLRTKNQRKTPAHYNLLIWVSMQDKRKEHTISARKLAKMIFEEEAYKINPSRCENQMGAIFEVLKCAGVIYEYSITSGRGGKQVKFRRQEPTPTPTLKE